MDLRELVPSLHARGIRLDEVFESFFSVVPTLEREKRIRGPNIWLTMAKAWINLDYSDQRLHCCLITLAAEQGQPAQPVQLRRLWITDQCLLDERKRAAG